MEPDKE